MPIAANKASVKHNKKGKEVAREADTAAPAAPSFVDIDVHIPFILLYRLYLIYTSSDLNSNMNKEKDEDKKF